MDTGSDFVIRPKRTKAHVPWIVKVSEIPSQGVFFTFNSTKGEINEALTDILGSEPKYQTEVSLKSSDKMIILTADLKATMPLTCSRCAEGYCQNIDKASTIAFYRSESDHMKAMSDDLNDIQGSFDLEFLESNEIDVSEVIHEQLALEIPFQPLCKSECLGLCPQCGINFNLKACDCNQKPDGFSPFAAALKNIKTR